MSDLPQKPEADLYLGIREVLLVARTTVQRAVNDTMVQAYWRIGRLIVEDEQGGVARAFAATTGRIRQRFNLG